MTPFIAPLFALLSDAAIMAIIVAIPTFLASLAAFINSVRNSGKTEQVDKKVDALTTHVDGKMEELLVSTRLGARAEGVTEGRGAAVLETQARTAELERVEDRAENRKLKTEN